MIDRRLGTEVALTRPRVCHSLHASRRARPERHEGELEIVLQCGQSAMAYLPRFAHGIGGVTDLDNSGSKLFTTVRRLPEFDRHNFVVAARGAFERPQVAV